MRVWLPLSAASCDEEGCGRVSSRCLTSFSEDAPPVPLKLVVLAGAQQVEHDATETKFCKLILHKGLILFSVVFQLVYPSSVDFPFVRKSVHTENGENCTRLPRISARQDRFES